MGRVHSFGCRLASKGNAKRKGGALRLIYCGAYEVTLDALHAQCLQIPGLAYIGAVHVIEEGEIAHANLQFRFSAPPSTKDDIAFWKTDLMNEVSCIARGPLKHICGQDQYVIDHPSNKLVVLPAGLYGERRSIASCVRDFLGYVCWATCYSVCKFLRLSR
jgi:hypothetical protein